LSRRCYASAQVFRIPKTHPTPLIRLIPVLSDHRVQLTPEILVSGLPFQEYMSRVLYRFKPRERFPPPKINLSKVFAGQYIGVTEVDTDIQRNDSDVKSGYSRGADIKMDSMLLIISGGEVEGGLIGKANRDRFYLSVTSVQ
jgi:hypothetical protein